MSIQISTLTGEVWEAYIDDGIVHVKMGELDGGTLCSSDARIVAGVLRVLAEEADR